MEEKDWIALIEALVVITAIILPFALYGWIMDIFARHWWLRFIMSPVTDILSVGCIVAFIKMLAIDKWTGTTIVLTIVLFLFGCLSTIASCLQISYFMDTWHWSAWIIGGIIWLVLAIPTVAITNNIFTE